MRTALILVAAALALALAWFASLGGGPAAPPPSSLAAAPAAGAQEDVAAVAGVEPDRGADEAPARREAEPEPPGESAPALDPDAFGRLEVQVVEQETGAPLEGARLFLNPADPPEEPGGADADDAPAAPLVHWLERDPTAEEGQPPHTDEDGRATFLVVPGRGFRLWASASESGSSTREDLEPFRAGERRALQVELRTRPDLHFVGRVVLARGGAPVADAEVRLQAAFTTLGGEDGRRTEYQVHERVRTDAEGWFEADVASWRLLHGRVDTPGLGTAVFPVERGHGDRESALIVQLEPAAVLRGRVLQADDPSAHAVLARADGGDLQRQFGGSFLYVGEMPFGAEVAADGSWELPGLPARAGLTLELRRGGKLVQRHEGKLRLEPGETCSVDFRVGSGATLRGMITLHGSGEPLVGHGVWLVPGAEAHGFLRRYDSPVAKTTTDDEGRFTFEDVSPGVWAVGPEPVRDDWAPATGDEVAPATEAVTVRAGDVEVTVALVVHRGLFIDGEVRGVDGEPVSQGYVWGTCKDCSAWVGAQAPGGAFRLGPLIPGSYELTGNGDAERCSPSEPVVVPAGARDVVLQLRPGGALRGHLVEAASGEPVSGEVRVVPEQGTAGSMIMTIAQADGRFEFGGLPPGSYTVLGSSGELVGEAAGLSVVPGKALDDVDVLLVPSARLMVGYTGSRERVAVRVLRDGVTVQYASTSPGQPAPVALPAGRYVVRYRLPQEDGTARDVEREVELTAGEETTVTVGDDDR